MPKRIALVINTPSNGAKALANALGCRRVRPERMNVISRNKSHLFVNWGCADVTQQLCRPGSLVLNANTSIASNKRQAFDLIKANAPDVRLPEHTTSLQEARRWVTEGNVVLARTTLTGHSGAGIHVCRTSEELDAVQNVKMYVKYVRKTKEYRLHVVKDKVIFIQEKRKSNEVQQAPDQALIRSHRNGWVFCTQDVDPPETVVSTAIRTVKALNLDFAAVDIIVEKRTNNVVVLEANTRPGIESPQLLSKYTEALAALA